MMSGENSCDGVFKKRSALGDVTNLVGKRGLSEISGGDFEDRKKGKSVKQVCLESTAYAIWACKHMGRLLEWRP